MLRKTMWRIGVAGLLAAALIAPAAAGDSPSVEELKARVARANVGDRPPLCLHIAEGQMEAAMKFYGADDSEKAKATLSDVVAYAELDRDYAIQARKHEKQSEIAIRKMARKLSDFKHTVGRDDQEELQRTVDRLQQIRDDLLSAMFTKGGKK